MTQMNYTSKATSHPPTDERDPGENESGLDESTHQVRVVISPSFRPGGRERATSHTSERAGDRESVRAQKEVSKSCPKTLPTSCSVVTGS